MINFFDLFPTRIWRVQDLKIDYKLLISRLENEQRRDPVGKKISNIGDNWQSHFLDESFDDLRDIYVLHSHDIVKAHAISVASYEPYVKCMWVNISNHAGFNLPHDHIEEDGFYSFVHYIELPDITKKWKNYLNFKTDRPSLKHFRYPVIEHNELTSRETKFYIQPGDLLLFPEWLEHRTVPNDTVQRKISIAGNIGLRTKKEK
jgi:uncharacterized protein (TIGR02466 family)